MTENGIPRTKLARTNLEVTRLGFGAASIGGLFGAVARDQAIDTVESAWDAGIRYYDVAPLYGYGSAEERLGAVLRQKPRGSFVLSTKVGRLLLPAEVADAPGVDRDRQDLDGVPDAWYKGVPPVRPVFDFSADGVRRSLEASLERLGLDAVDIVYIHDPDLHWRQAISGAYPALHRMREEGIVRAIGAGMNQTEMLARFAREGDFDVFLCAGRYTLLDQTALAELLPLCVERRISIVVGGVMNSGLLANPKAGARFNYRPASAAILDRALQLEAVCTNHGVPVRAAALQFVLAHPAVASVVAGVRRSAHVLDTLEMLRHSIPEALWAELKERELIAADAPVPTDRSAFP
jgi:D-threo-aldose 1-dehydrogenase